MQVSDRSGADWSSGAGLLVVAKNAKHSQRASSAMACSRVLPWVGHNSRQMEHSTRRISPRYIRSSPTFSVLGPGRHDPSHARIRDQLTHVLIGMNDDAEIHAIHGRIAVGDVDLTIEVFRVLS